MPNDNKLSQSMGSSLTEQSPLSKTGGGRQSSGKAGSGLKEAMKASLLA